jgi:hypothetical protein
VRRTVRVATALVAGQALLCAVIGWVTIGPPDAGPRAARTVEPLAAPPVVPSLAGPAPAPPRVSPPPDSAQTPSPRGSRARSSASRAPAPPRRTRATTKPAPPPDESPTLVIAPPEPGETRTTPDPGIIGTVAPSPVETVQGPVTVGEECEPEGAPGITADDRKVRCVRNDDGDLRWQII